MDSSLKKKLRALSLALRHTLEGTPGQAGDLESRLNQMGVWRDRPPKPAEELGLDAPDQAARRIVDAFLTYREEAGVSQREAFAEFVRESAYSWANRLFMLRCLESRGLIEEVILQKPVYGGRSLVHYRFAQQNPSACVGEDDGLFAVIEDEFGRRTAELQTVFDPHAPAIALRPSVSALKRCVGLLSGSIPLNGQGEATDELFEAADAPGWAYQFWNAEEKDHVFERVRTQKGAKIQGADLIPATQLYTDPYMVKFLVQNSLGAFWAGMYPETRLTDGWEYYVRDADRNPPVQPDPPPFDPAKPPPPSADPWVRPSEKLYTESGVVAYGRTLTAKVPGAEADGFVDLRNQLLEAVAKPVLEKLISLNQKICEAWDRDWPSRRPKLKKHAAELTLLDPACGSGHFLLEAFDLLYAMYEEEGMLRTPEDRCASILNHNLFGIDIDERAIQISVAALWMHALERAPTLRPEVVNGLGDHLIASNLSLPRGRAHLEEFLGKHSDDAELRPALEAIFRGLADADQLGTLLRIEEPVEQELQRRKDEEDRRAETVLRQSQTKLEFMTEQYVLALPPARDYEAWKRDVLRRLKEHFRQEAAVSDPAQGFFGRDTTRGLTLFELLARRYDVVAANPPYMGSKNMGADLKRFVGRHFPTGKRDLYAAFILRCLELAADGGRIAMVTQQSWMFLKSYANLRAADQTKPDGGTALPEGILRNMSLEALAHLGRYAFSEIGNAAVAPVMFILTKTPPTTQHRIWACRLTAPRESHEQAALLRSAATQTSSPLVFHPSQARFLAVPESPICYWLRERFFDLLAGRTISDVADVCQGLATADDSRFVRFVWEAPLKSWVAALPSRRWVPFEKGGGYGKWFGHHFWTVDWEHDGARIRATPGPRVQNERHYFKKGWTYSFMASGSVGFRTYPAGTIFAAGASAGVVGLADGLAPVANCRFASYVVRSISAKIQLNESYVSRIPLPAGDFDVSLSIESSCVSLKSWLVARDSAERTFRSLPITESSLLSAYQKETDCFEGIAAALHTIESVSEQHVFRAYGMETEDLAAVVAETGKPAGWLPLIVGNDLPPLLPKELSLPADFLKWLAASPRITPSPDELAEIKKRLRLAYESGPGAEIVADAEDAPAEKHEEDEEEEDGEQEVISGARILIPCETFLEQLAHRIEVHPLSTFWLLRHMRQEEGLVCAPQYRRFVEDYVSVLVLRVLGHQWPGEAGETASVSLPDGDGIVPLTEGTAERMLISRVCNWLAHDFGAERVPSIGHEFERAVGKPLGAWLAHDFSRCHVVQCRKRPIAWQVETKAVGGAETPIFSCLINAHRATGALPSLRVHYAGALRVSFESEQRTLERLTQLTVDQAVRKDRLAVWIDELKQFQDTLEDIEARGFGTPEVRQYAIRDAVQSLARCWLGRLREELRSGPLRGWQEKAELESLHADLPGWIAEAVEHIDRQCVALAPESPPPESPDDELTPRALAQSFRGRAPSMIRTAIEAVCREWQARFDKVMIQPIREQVKAAEIEYKQLDNSIENKPRRKDLKSRMKALKKEIANLDARSGALAAKLQDWRFAQAESWIDWLETQPLYDEFTSLDGHRPIPQTVAELVSQESQYAPDVNDGVRVNIAPLQKAGILARDVLAAKDVEKAIADRAEWRADERRWCRQGVLPQPGWWPEPKASTNEGEETAYDIAGR